MVSLKRAAPILFLVNSFKLSPKYSAVGPNILSTPSFPKYAATAPTTAAVIGSGIKTIFQKNITFELSDTFFGL